MPTQCATGASQTVGQNVESSVIKLSARHRWRAAKDSTAKGNASKTTEGRGNLNADSGFGQQELIKAATVGETGDAAEAGTTP